jgi:hypothetical protein
VALQQAFDHAFSGIDRKKLASIYSGHCKSDLGEMGHTVAS